MANTITDTTTGEVSPISRVYRVQDGAARLFVGRDRKIWIGYGDEPEAFSFLGRLPDDAKICRDDVCRAANCW